MYDFSRLRRTTQRWAMHMNPVMKVLRNMNYRTGLVKVQFYVDARTLNIVWHNETTLDPICNNWLLGWAVTLSDGTTQVVMNPEYFGPMGWSPLQQLKEAKRIFPNDRFLDKVHEWKDPGTVMLRELIKNTELQDVTSLNRFQDWNRKTPMQSHGGTRRLVRYAFVDGRFRPESCGQIYLILFQE